MLVLGTTILIMQAVFMPVGMVYAETTMDTEEQELMEIPPMKNYLEEEQISDPRFFFTRSQMQGTAEEPLQVTFFSDQEVSEASIFLPEEAMLLKDQLSTGISVEEGAQPNEWIVQSKRAQNTFVLPLVVEQAGNYELSVEETTAHLEISEKEETSEEVPVEETESSDEDQAGQKELKEENGIEEAQENEQPAEEVREPVSEAPQEQQTDEEGTDEASQVVEPTVFDGETAEVATMAEFREAVGNPDIGIISVQANLTEATANVLTVDRPLLIQGNGYTLTFGINGFYFQLEEVTQASTIRIENATLTKVGVTPLINATVENSKNWTVELEDITELNANTMRLASLPEGSIHFTGGVSNFTRTASAQTFIEAKEVLATNQAEVNISRGNATVFFSSATVVAPKITVEQGATVTIATTAGVANTIDLRGENPEVFLQSGELDIATVGTTAAPTDTTNNTIALTGTTPKITINSSAQLTVRSTLAKRGIHLAGNNAQLLVNNSDLSVTSATQAAINITGESPKLIFDSSVVNVTSTTGQRINLIGTNPLLSLDSTEMIMNASTGRGIYLQGETPQVLMENSQTFMTDTGASQGMIIQGTDALLSLSNQSELAITGAGTGALENIQIGNNNARPELSVTGESKLSVTTTSGTGAATDTANNAIHLRGADPKTTVTGGSELLVSITSNARRGVYLNGDNANLSVTDSLFDVTTVSGQTLNLTGISPKITMNKSKATIVSTTGISMTLSGSDAILEANESELAVHSTTGQRMNLIGSNPVLNLKNSQLDMSATTGRGIYFQGETPQLLMDDSQLFMTDNGASQGIILQGTDALLSLINQSELAIVGAGTGTTENIQIGNNNARPKILVTDESNLSVKTTSGTGTASVTANNAIHLRGNEPELQVLAHSKVSIDITSGNRRGILLTGNTSNAIVSSSNLIMSLEGSGVGFSASGTLNSLSVKESEVNIYGNSGHNIYLEGSNSILSLNNSIVNLEAENSGRNIWLVGSDSVFSVENGAKVKTISDNANSITLHGARPLLKMTGYQTNMETISNVSAAETNASIFLGAASTGAGASNPNAEINLSEGAKLSVHSNRSSAMSLLSSNGQFNLLNHAELNLTAGDTDSSANGAVAVLRFIRVGGYQFTIDNAKMNISKTGGRTPGIRMNGGNNHIEVKNGGQFFIHNPGNGTPINQDTSSGLANQGVHYPNGGNNSFIVDGLGSSVEIIADFGPAIDMESQIGQVEARNQATFIVEGRTSTDAAGIFNAGNLTVKFDNPLFMDFRNTRPSGGNIFNVSSGSILSAIDSDLSVWKKGVDLEGDPKLNFLSIDYSFSGTNFNILGETSDSDQLNTSVFGTVGLTAYSRLSSNNARWAIADELRVPTNADKKIHGRVSIPVGLDGSRPAWDNEAIVTVEVESPSGETTEEYTAKTVGDTNESPGISIYGEEPRGGIFEIDLDESLEAGSKVRISKVELTSGEITDGFEHQILTDTVEVFPIIPPTPAQFSSSIIAQDSTMIRGMTDNLDTEVTATHNGEPLSTESVSVEADGRFTLDLSEVSLEMDDEIQVFLRDAEGSAVEAGVVNPPETNNTRGNINPTTEFTFHDITFEPATTLLVGETGTVSPVDPLDPEVEVDPENKPELPEDQGQLSIDFISSFNFGSQAISVHDQTYYAKAQRLLNEDGTVNETEERPNYIQISDRRPESERNGWDLAVTQKEQFKGEGNQMLNGASLNLLNQQVITAQGGDAPELQSVHSLIPENRQLLLKAQGSEGTGTWIYRFGDGETAGESVALDVPRGANPETTTYSTTLIWELSAVPGN